MTRAGRKLVRRFVALRFKPDVSESVKEGVFSLLERFRERLAGIRDIQFRRNLSSDDQVHHGFRDVYWIDFQNAEALAAYLVDPARQTLVQRIRGLSHGGTKGILIVEYEL